MQDNIVSLEQDWMKRNLKNTFKTLLGRFIIGRLALIPLDWTLFLGAWKLTGFEFGKNLFCCGCCCWWSCVCCCGWMCSCCVWCCWRSFICSLRSISNACSRWSCSLKLARLAEVLWMFMVWSSGSGLILTSGSIKKDGFSLGKKWKNIFDKA